MPTQLCRERQKLRVCRVALVVRDLGGMFTLVPPLLVQLPRTVARGAQLHGSFGARV